ncbi:MAG: Spy/CpxP family protein refolding chaperone [Gemmatimonadales bacterium]|jgi:Spy/CpxP family protein refolding chaperone
MQHIRSALAGAMLVLGGAALASAQQATPAPAPQTQQHAEHAHRGFGARGDRALLKGITLSDAEKANLKTVHAKYASQLKALREQSKPTFESARAARQRGDTAAARAIMAKAAPQREQMRQLMKTEQNDLRGALTPANQAKFDANVKNFKSHAARAAKREAGAWNKGGHAGVQVPTYGSTRG